MFPCFLLALNLPLSISVSSLYFSLFTIERHVTSLTVVAFALAITHLETIQ